MHMDTHTPFQKPNITIVDIATTSATTCAKTRTTVVPREQLWQLQVPQPQQNEKLGTKKQFFDNFLYLSRCHKLVCIAME